MVVVGNPSGGLASTGSLGRDERLPLGSPRCSALLWVDPPTSSWMCKGRFAMIAKRFIPIEAIANRSLWRWAKPPR